MPLLENSVCNVKPSSAHADYLRSVSLFIIDETSMVPSLALEAIDRMLRDITNTDMPFGGKIILLGGDFRQVLTVIPKRPRAVIVENCLKSSTLASFQSLQTHKEHESTKRSTGIYTMAIIFGKW